MQVVQAVKGPDLGLIAQRALSTYGQVKGMQQQQKYADIQDQERFAKESSQLAANLRGKTTDEKIATIKNRVADLKERGIPSDSTERLLGMYESGQAGEKGLQSGLGSMQQAEHFSQQAAQIQEADAALEDRYQLGIQRGYVKAPEKGKDKWEVLTGQQKEQYGIVDPASYQMSPQGQIKKIGGGQVINVNTGQQEDIKVGAIPKGYGLRRGKDGSYEYIAIKGGPAAQKKAENEEKKVLFKEKTGQDADIVLKATRGLIGKLEKESIFNPITGPLGAIAENFRGSEAADAEGLRDTIGAGVAFKSLQDMRASNKTGGGLGAISEKEMELLKASMGAFDKTLSRESQLTALRDLDKVYSGILSKARAYPESNRFGFGAEAIPVGSNQAEAVNQVNQQQMPQEVRQRYY